MAGARALARAPLGPLIYRACNNERQKHVTFNKLTFFVKFKIRLRERLREGDYILLSV
jgi:hypothetical protein